MAKTDIVNFEKNLLLCDGFRLNRMFCSQVHRHWGFRDRRNTDQHLIYVVSGSGYYSVEGTEVTLRHGLFMFLGRGVQHSSGFYGNERPFIMPVRFSLMRSGTVCDELMSGPCFLKKNLSKTGYAETMLTKLFRLYTNPGPQKSETRQRQISSLIRLLLMEFLEEDGTVPAEDPRIREVLSTVHNTPWKRRTLDELAASCRLSAKQFSRLFRAETGKSPMDYIRYHRCQYAKEELGNSGRSIAEISGILGYPDPYTFSRQFKKYAGISPKKWRERQKHRL